MIGGSKPTKIKKKYLDAPELNEYGVYNSETDTNTNPKTGENKPDELTGFMSALTDRVSAIVAELKEAKEFVRSETQLSYDPLDICIAELESYINSLGEESEASAAATPN